MTDHTPENDPTRYVHGTYSLQSVITLNDVGTLTKVQKTLDFMIDTQTQEIVQVGDSDLDITDVEAFQQMLNIDPSEFWPHLNNTGDTP
jgi:hypothetical protein